MQPILGEHGGASDMNKKWISCIAAGLFLVTGCGEDPQPPQAYGNAVTHNNPELERQMLNK